MQNNYGFLPLLMMHLSVLVVYNSLQYVRCCHNENIAFHQDFDPWTSSLLLYALFSYKCDTVAFYCTLPKFSIQLCSLLSNLYHLRIGSISLFSLSRGQVSCLVYLLHPSQLSHFLSIRMCYSMSSMIQDLLTFLLSAPFDLYHDSHSSHCYSLVESTILF